MERFFIRLCQFSLLGLVPLIMMLFLYIRLDPFKVLYHYDTYYDSHAKGRVGLNKDYVSTTNFVNNRNKYHTSYDSFIFGNSRSIFYQSSDWKKHLPPKSTCYYFNAAGEALWGINKKIDFIDKTGLEIKNMLLILDYSTLIQDKPKSGHLYIISPILVGNSNLFEFHFTFFKTFLNPKFLYAYIDFSMTGVVKPYMKNNFLLSSTPVSYDERTNEMRYDYYEDLINKKQYYDSTRVSVFYQRDSIQQYSPVAIHESQKIILTNIQQIVQKHKTNIKIVISPLYDQIKLNENDVRYLKNLFGAQNVFDYSGINKFTNSYENYYETSHYRPHVAKEIMEEIYNTDEYAKPDGW